MLGQVYTSGKQVVPSVIGMSSYSPLPFTAGTATEVICQQEALNPKPCC